MDILNTLQSGQSKNKTLAIMKFIGNDKKRFAELVKLFLEGDYRITQRAAWPLGDLSIEKPKLVKPYIGKLIKKLEEPGHHPAIPRNILRIFQFVEIPEEHQGQLVDICFRNIMNETQPVAIRAFAITVATRICSPYPELKNELLLLLNELNALPQTAAIKVRVKSALKELQKEKV